MKMVAPPRLFVPYPAFIGFGKEVVRQEEVLFPPILVYHSEHPLQRLIKTFEYIMSTLLVYRRAGCIAVW